MQLVEFSFLRFFMKKCNFGFKTAHIPVAYGVIQDA